MTTKPIEDGGPAFPSPPACDGIRKGVAEGLSMRDYFAAKAMSRLIDQTMIALYEPNISAMARASYFIADAMLKARQS